MALPSEKFIALVKNMAAFTTKLGQGIKNFTSLKGSKQVFGNIDTFDETKLFNEVFTRSAEAAVVAQGKDSGVGDAGDMGTAMFQASEICSLHKGYVFENRTRLRCYCDAMSRKLGHGAGTGIWLKTTMSVGKTK